MIWALNSCTSTSSASTPWHLSCTAPALSASGIVEHSAGWKFFEQVQMVRRTLLGPPCLEDLQIYCLSVQFLLGTSAPQACWTIVGIGIRLAQDVGAHRRKSYNEKLTVEGELWKRVFWVLVMFDRAMSSSLGRPCAIQDEDFDLDLPVECDDEYWEHPDPQQVFKQPPDKPSILSFFITYLQLTNILSFAHRTIYSINKSKILLGFVGQQWEQHIVAELDSSLNKWIDEVPDHLRWDPTRDANSLFFMQSSALYANYYHVQIFIHRPFIPSPRKPSPLSFPSLAICTNAARSCSHVIDIYRRRSGVLAPFLQVGYDFVPLERLLSLFGRCTAFTAGIVLLLNIWGGKRSGVSTDPIKEMADVHKCMGLLKSCENRWHSSGRLWDILYELASVGDLPLPQPSPQGTKRERDSDSPPPASRPVSTHKEGARTTAGTRRVSREIHSYPQSQQHRQQPPPSQPSQSYSLPVYSNDLARIPLHGQGDFPNDRICCYSVDVFWVHTTAKRVVRVVERDTATYQPITACADKRAQLCARGRVLARQYVYGPHVDSIPGVSRRSKRTPRLAMAVEANRPPTIYRRSWTPLWLVT
ncbi:hypothetical protein J3R82DRAFT_12012 [Butyriboletus roseoflavus]|nr:hypothetical protein J3R82DRAFT_12012 [Butyriboletus roseoflavus]